MKQTISMDDDEYIMIGHGEGSPIDEYYQTLPEISKTASVIGEGIHKRFAPSPVLKLKPDVLPGIKPGKRNGPLTPQAPSTPKLKKTRPARRKKSPSELTERDLDPANKFAVLPQINNAKKGTFPLLPAFPATAKSPSPSPELNLPCDVRAYKREPLPNIKTAADDMCKYKSRDGLKSRNAATTRGIMGLHKSPDDMSSRLATRGGKCGRVIEVYEPGVFSTRSSENEMIVNYEDYRTESRLDALIRSDLDMLMGDVYSDGSTDKKIQLPTTSSASLKPSQKLDMMLDAAYMHGTVDSGFASGGSACRSSESRRSTRDSQCNSSRKNKKGSAQKRSASLRLGNGDESGACLPKI